MNINKEFFDKNNWDLEIIVVDGDSKDKTKEIAREKGAKVIVEKRKGYGRAYKTGLPIVTGDIIVTGDADATYPFDRIHEYIQRLVNKNLDFITTNRLVGLRDGAMTVKNRFGNMVLNIVLIVLFWIDIRDSQSGMWIFKRDVLAKIQPLEDFDDGMAFSEELKIEMFTSKNVKAREIPSTLYTREGRAKLETLRDGWKNLKFAFKKRIKS